MISKVMATRPGACKLLPVGSRGAKVGVLEGTMQFKTHFKRNLSLAPQIVALNLK